MESGTGAAVLRVSHLDQTSFAATLADATRRDALERLPEAVVVFHRDQTIL